MKHSVDKEGNITLMPSPKEMEIQIKALQTKNLMLRTDRLSKDTCDEILKMLVVLNSALVESNRIRLQNVCQKDTQKPAPGNRLFKRIFNFFNPPFSTGDFEKSDSFCGSLFHIEMLEFEISGSNFPYKATGHVQHNRAWLDCSWNAHGKCTCPKLGKEAYLFDLVRQRKCKTIPPKYSDVAVVLSLIATIIFSVTQ